MAVRKRKSVPLWVCDDCGGPAVWTFIEGDAHYHCERQCDGFMQLELFSTSGVDESMRGHETLDAGRPTPTNELPF